MCCTTRTSWSCMCEGYALVYHDAPRDELHTCSEGPSVSHPSQKGVGATNHPRSLFYQGRSDAFSAPSRARTPFCEGWLTHPSQKGVGARDHPRSLFYQGRSDAVSAPSRGPDTLLRRVANDQFSPSRLASRPELRLLLLGDRALVLSDQRRGPVAVQLDILDPPRRHINVREDGLDRALGQTIAAINAIIRIDVQHPVVLVEASVGQTATQSVYLQSWHGSVTT